MTEPHRSRIFFWGNVTMFCGSISALLFSLDGNVGMTIFNVVEVSVVALILAFEIWRKA